MEEDFTTLLTVLGTMRIENKNLIKTYDDLGINIVDDFGPYKLASLEISLVSSELLKTYDLQDCYIAHNGIVLHCSSDNKLSIPVYKVYSVYMSKKSIIICFDECPKLFIDGKSQPFYILSSSLMMDAHIIEVYNLYEEGDYHIILNPSKNFLKYISDRFYLCLIDKNGWAIADGKVKLNIN
ncbi:hypothetical protein DpV84gp134 [Deerpox virus W-1170-84]|uniref:MHC class II presentation inhibitor n=1 Tax=Deerpox virus (strain W-1170-84) TaxID=305676 RepID=Q08F48_DPV84|nr:hypothetical protein DpV84gp134 [Deerpox virus W-1170-84]AYC44678.1 hypothetical protein [Moosepox virus GoldyGopher14]